MSEFKWPQEGAAGSGDVVGPGSSTDNAVARFDGTGGKTLQNSGVLIDDSNNVTGVASIALPGGDVQTQIDAADTAIADHILDPTAAHAASAVSNTPSGNLAATDVQGALNELQTDVDTRATSSNATFTGTTTFSALTADTVPYLNASKVLVSSGVTPTQLSYVDATSSIQTQLNSKQATGNYITALTGDVTASGPGSVAATLANTGTAGTYVKVTTDAKGRVTSGVAGPQAIADGGTGQTTATAAFDALAPTTTLGDISYHNGTDNVRLAGNTNVEPAVLVQTGSGSASAAPVWRRASSLGLIRLHTGDGYGSTNTAIRKFTTTVVNTITGLTYATSATDGASFTCTEAGIYAFSYSDAFNTAAAFGLSLNSNQLTTNIASITTADCLLLGVTSDADFHQNLSITLALAVNDVVRPHAGTTQSSNPSRCRFTVQRIA